LDHELHRVRSANQETSLLVRSVAKNELGAFSVVLESAFGISRKEADSLVDRLIRVAPLERTRGAFAGSELIGTLGCFPFDLAVPGGTLQMAGTALVSVLPTYRKQGVMRALMKSHLDEARALGEPLAGLWTTGGSLYGRYGYGPATDAQLLELDSRSVRFRSDDSELSIRLIADDDVEHILPQVYERVRRHRPGVLSRTDSFWRFGPFADLSDQGGDAGRVAVHDAGGTADGYVAYTLRREGSNNTEGVVQIAEMMSTTPASHEAMWRYVTRIEMYPNVEYANQAVDDPLRWLLVDQRIARQRIKDALWLRILDVERALEGREYGSAGTLLVGIMDPLYEDISGTYLLEVTDGGATCRRVEAAAEVTMDIDVLASLYLGGHDVGSLARAGRIRFAGEAEAKAHRMFKWDRSPWCPQGF